MARKQDRALLGHPGFPLVVFAVLTLGGCAFIAVVKLSGVNPIVAAGLPVCLMFFYLGVSIFTGKLRLHDEQTGDNLYYMGFLFTLTSLGVSLFQFGSEGSTEMIVRNFGIAVTSTITGIALRGTCWRGSRNPERLRYSIATVSSFQSTTLFKAGRDN